MVDNPKTYPKTSLPSVDLYYKTFEKYVKEDIPIVCFTISLIFSGSYNSARNAKELILEEYQMLKFILLTRSKILLLKYYCWSNGKNEKEQLAFGDSIRKIEKVIASARIFFTVGSLDYLQMGGRIGKVAAAASKIDVKPVIIMKDGDIGLGGIGRNRNKLKKKYWKLPINI